MKAAAAAIAGIALAGCAYGAGATGAVRLTAPAGWASPEARTQLLFVSDAGTADVYMYEIPSLKVAGTITGFTQPQGECANTKGDVWIADVGAQTTYEVSHEGRLVNMLADSSAYPEGCAWDPASGKLAVTSLFGKNGSRGKVLVYPSGSKVPTAYVNPHQYYYNFAGYDGAGNLFFDGRNAGGAFMLSELPKGAESVATLKVSGGKIYFPGMVEWDGGSGQLLVGDQDCGNEHAACIYRLTIVENGANIVGSTKLQNSAGGQVCDLVQGVEANGRIWGSDNEFCGHSASTTDAWAYPGGGRPTAENGRTDSAPVGAALSGGK